MMKANEITQRWKTTTGEAFLKEFLWKSYCEINTSPFGRTEWDRLDLRGMPLETSKIVHTLTLRNVDLTGAVFDRVGFQQCRFEDVVFDRASLVQISDHENSFLNCSFTKTNLRRAALGYRGSRFCDCVFTASNFRGAVFIRPEFDRVGFHGCHLDGVDFNGSSFVSCTFKGLVKNVWLRGGLRSQAAVEEYGRGRTNRMENTSFEDAELQWVTFSDECDLSTVTMPSKGDYRRFDRWKERLENVMRIATELAPAERREAEVFCRIFLPHAEKQTWYILNVDEQRAEFGEDLMAKLLSALECG